MSKIEVLGTFEAEKLTKLKWEQYHWQWWAFCSEKGRGRVVQVFKSEFQIHEIGIVPNLWLFRPSDI